MKINFYFFCLLLCLIAKVNIAGAEPRVDINTSVLRKGKWVYFQLYQHDVPSMSRCHYNFFAADAPKSLQEFPGKAISIATFERDEELIEILATHLRPLSRESFGKRFAKVFVRMLMFCSQDEQYLSDIHLIKLPTHRRGKARSVRRSIIRMKYHMRYAADVPNWNGEGR